MTVPRGPARGWVSLAQPVWSGLPSPGPRGVADIQTLTEPIGGDGRVRLTLLQMAAHVGTHLDAPAHFVAGGATIDAYPVDRFCGEGTVIDLSDLGIREVPAALLEPRIDTVRPGDFVFLDFGWAVRYGTDEYRDHPYLGVDAAHLLIERGAGVVGVDTPTPDLPAVRRKDGFAFPVHRALLGADVLIMENVSAAVSAFRGRRLDVQAVPVPLRGADGAPCVPLVRAR
ncbi:cyclase family protein [Streptomyces sp. NPDC050625]|uniref:cyclase family protein n=1 Tax=Streptomyces sp. NPDC050625 TaxID=3154629 RepID=UPI00342219E2